MATILVTPDLSPSATEAAAIAPLTPSAAPLQFEPAGEPLLAEVRVFAVDCAKRYRFNNRWDVVLSVLGILLSIAIVAAGFEKEAELSAILGAVVGAVVTAQKAFPFGQRAGFYRLLIGNTDNLLTRATQGLWDKKDVVNTLSTLRLDFAQQLPRGTNAPGPAPAPPAPAPPASSPK